MIKIKIWAESYKIIIKKGEQDRAQSCEDFGGGQVCGECTPGPHLLLR